MTRKELVIDIALHCQNSSSQQGIIEMLLNFMCCNDLESDPAARILKKAKKIAVSIPGVESVAEGKGGEKNVLTVIGEEIDPVRLVQLLQKKGCCAELKEFGPKQTKSVAEPPVPVTVPPICCPQYSSHWEIVEIREPTSCFYF